LKTETPKNELLVDQLLGICRDRGNLAALRRYWSPATRHYAYPILGRLGALDAHRLGDALTATLYSTNPSHQLGGSTLGKACLSLGKGDAFESMERHFRRLLAFDTSELVALGDQLHRLFIRFAGDGIALDYNRLLWDLRKWSKSAEDIKARWACDFWQAPIESSQGAPR